jgi:AcrR family transcriptional regulator
VVTREPPLRRVPRQTRGQQRIAAILDAAEQLFAELGYEATTTNAIASRAHTAIGSLYQFFPNKEAILRALVGRFLDALREVLDRALTDVATETDLAPGSVLDRVLDPLLALRAARGRSLEIYLSTLRFGGVAAATRTLTEEIVTRVEALLAAHLPPMASSRRRLAAQVVVETTKALLPLTSAPDGTLRRELVAELKLLLRAYLAAVQVEAMAQ